MAAPPYMAELAMVGSGVEQYQLWLGGSPGLTRLARPVLQKMPLAEMESTLRPLLSQWQEQAPKQSLAITAIPWAISLRPCFKPEHCGRNGRRSPAAPGPELIAPAEVPPLLGVPDKPADSMA